MTTLADAVKVDYSLSLSPDYAERCERSMPNLTSSELYQKALRENLRDICGPSLLPYGVASQVQATLPNAVVLQINQSRDATQPLRPCADTTDEDALLNAATQRNSDKRLLRLLLTDGNTEIPALELSTLHVFRGIPVPGEKLLIDKDTEVRNGCILLSDTNVSLLGGEVSQLKQDFLAHRRRLEAGYQTSNGLSGAPQFAPLELGQHYNTSRGNSAMHGADNMQRGAAPPFGHNGDRGRGSGGHRGGGDFQHHRGGGGYDAGRRDMGAGGGEFTNVGDCGFNRGGSNHNRGRGQRGRGGGDFSRGRGDFHRGRGDRQGRGRGYGDDGGGYRGRGGGDAHYVDSANYTSQAEKFPVMNETNFPRLS